ncbi:MAG: DUF4340 domain-containing protein [Spirochaetaceae bacterium]|jgi:hypothetical protein|nr:DUF4340 domain-containing protein [Spirochaetaceae bacterium]
MHYRTKIKLLSAVLTLLTLVLIATFILDPDRLVSQNAIFAWLPPRQRDRVDRLEITGDTGTVYLVKDSAWSVNRNGTLYPAKPARVEDVLQILSYTDKYPLYSTNANSHARLGLTEDTASRIVARAGNELVMDLLIGDSNATATERYLRKNGSDEVRSGLDTLSGYLSSPLTAWSNLRLFLESSVTVADVQRIIVSKSDSEAWVISRSANGWLLGERTANTQKVESYIRAVLDTEAEDFSAEPVGTSESRIDIETGNGALYTIRLGASTDTNQRTAALSGSQFTYTLAAWTLSRILPSDVDYFF